MKRIALSILLCTLFGTAQAATSSITIDNQSTVNFSGYDGQPKDVTGTKAQGFFGALRTTVAGTFYATYLGNESGYVNSFTLTSVGTPSLLETNTVGKTISSLVGPGLVGFSFSDNQGATFSNGQAQTNTLGFAILSGITKTQGTFDYVLGFNDSYSSDADYDKYKLIISPN